MNLNSYEINLDLTRYLISELNNNIDKVFENFTYKLISYYEKNKGEYLGNERERKLSNSHKINTQIIKKKKMFLLIKFSILGLILCLFSSAIL